MSTKIAKTLHLTKGQWKTLSSIMEGARVSTPDPSVYRLCEIVDAVARDRPLPPIGMPKWRKG